MVGMICWKTEFLPLSQRFADRTAVVDTAGVVSYQQLFALAAGIGLAVGAAGARPGEAVGTLLPNSRLAVAASYGVTLAGMGEARLNVALGPEDLAHCLSTAGIKYVVTDRARAALVEQLGARAILAESAAPVDLAACEFPAVPNDGMGRIGFTSGTTGTPKGIVHSQEGRWIANVLLRAALPFAPGSGDNILLMTPFSHGACQMTYAFLDGGAAITILPGVDAKLALPLIDAGKVNHMFAPPTVLAKLLASAEQRPYPGLKAIYTGTSPLSGELYRRARNAFGPVIRVTYGKNEVWNPISVLAPAEAEAWYGAAGEPTSTCVGWPGAGVEVAIKKIEDEEETDARIGEVLLRARHMFVGHIAGGTLTPNPAGAFHETGDLGFLDEAGRLHLCGRSADVMKSGGYRILPEEVEAPLREAIAPAEIAILSLPSSYWGEIVTAAITGPPPPALAVAIGKLTRYKRPRLIAELDEIPRNAIGKVVRRRAREQILAKYELIDGQYPKLVRL